MSDNGDDGYNGLLRRGAGVDPTAPQSDGGGLAPGKMTLVEATYGRYRGLLPVNGPGKRTLTELLSGGSAARTPLLVDEGPVAPGQMLKADFAARLKPIVTAAANDELGRLGSATACPYIEMYFARYLAQPAASAEAMLVRWAGSAPTIDAWLPVLADRVRAGVRTWVQTGALPPDLAAADPTAAAAATTAATAATGATAAQPASLDALEAQLGPGAPVDSKLAAPLGAEAARVHTGPVAASKASEQGAVAFAVGSNVVMGANAPAPGTPAGDALLAHELAHTAQQKDAAKDPAARAKPIGPEDPQAEQNADAAAVQLATLGNFAGKVGDVMRTGVQLQRCANYQADVGLEKKLGLSLDIAPKAVGTTYIVGQTIELSIGQKIESPHKPMVYHWTLIDSRGNPFLAYGETTKFQLPWPGTVTLQADVGVSDGNNSIVTTTLEQKIECVRAGDRAGELVSQAKPPAELGEFRAQQDVNLALLSPDNKPSPDQAMFITSTGMNPAKRADGGSVAFSVENQKGVTEPAGRTFQWYAQPMSWEGMPDKLGSHGKTTVDGRQVYDLGSGRSAALATTQKGVFVVNCVAQDSGRRAAEASWIETVLEANEIDAVADLKTEMAAIDGHLGEFTKNAKGDPDLVPITAVHVDANSGAETTLNLYIGKRRDGTLAMLNASPGLKVSDNQLEFTGSSTGDVLDTFSTHNKYPAGAIRFHVPGGRIAGIDAADRTITTTGETRKGAIAGALGFAGLVLSVAAIPFTGGASATATVLFIGGAAVGVAAGAFSLADHLSSEDFTTGAVTLDCLQIAASVVDLGVAVKALRSSPALIVANRAVRYAMWTSLGIQSAAAVLISVDAIGKIEEIVENPGMSRSDKISALTRLLATMIITGALLVLSYKSLGQAKTRMREIFGPRGAALSDVDAAALGLVDDNVLRTLKSAQKDDLERLATMLREDPALATRLPGRKNVLGALKGCKTDQVSELESRFFQQRLGEAGVSTKSSSRIASAVKESGIDPAAANLLTDDDLKRIGRADDAFARAKGKRDADPSKATDTAAAKSELDGVTGITPGARDQLRGALAHVHGLPDPAFAAEPLAALRAKFPSIPPGDLAPLANLDRDALMALDSASEADIRQVLARLKSGSSEDVEGVLRSFFYKARKPARKQGDVYEPPANIGDRLDTAMDGLAQTRARGYPYGFASKPDYDKFMGAVKGALARRKIPTGDVRVHGSCVHNPNPGDVDVAVIVDSDTFSKLTTRFTEAAPNPAAKALVQSDAAKGKIASSNFFPEPGAPAESRVGTSLMPQISVIRGGSEFDLGPYLDR